MNQLIDYKCAPNLEKNLTNHSTRLNSGSDFFSQEKLDSLASLCDSFSKIPEFEARKQQSIAFRWIKITMQITDDEFEYFMYRNFQFYLLDYFFNPEKITPYCFDIIPLLFLNILINVPKYCSFFLTPEFAQRLILVSSHIPSNDEEFPNLKKDYFLNKNLYQRLNQLASAMIKGYPDLFENNFFIERFCMLIESNELDLRSTRYVFSVLNQITQISIISPDDCKIILRMLCDRLLDTESLHISESANMSVVLIQKNEKFLDYFCQTFDLNQLFELLNEFDDDCLHHVIHIFIALLQTKYSDTVEAVLNHNKLKTLFVKMSESYYSDEFFKSYCTLYLFYFSVYPQNMANVMQYGFLGDIISLCSKAFEVRIEAIKLLCFMVKIGLCRMVNSFDEIYLFLDNLFSVVEHENSYARLFVETIHILINFANETQNGSLISCVFQPNNINIINRILENEGGEGDGETKALWMTVLQMMPE